MGRVDLIEGVDAAVRVHLRACLRREASQAAHPPGGLERAVPRMSDRAAEATGERGRQLVEPVRLEAVLAQSVVRGAELVALGRVGGQPQAADRPKGVSGKLGKPAEVALCQLPEALRSLSPELPPGLVVVHLAAAQRKAAVAAAGAASDLARLVEAHGHPALSQSQRAGAARDAAAYNDCVGPFPSLRTMPLQGQRSFVFVEPVRGAHREPTYPGAESAASALRTPRTERGR
jgi:hypothetical protein